MFLYFIIGSIYLIYSVFSNKNSLIKKFYLSKNIIERLKVCLYFGMNLYIAINFSSIAFILLFSIENKIKIKEYLFYSSILFFVILFFASLFEFISFFKNGAINGLSLHKKRTEGKIIDIDKISKNKLYKITLLNKKGFFKLNVRIISLTINGNGDNNFLCRKEGHGSKSFEIPINEIEDIKEV